MLSLSPCLYASKRRLSGFALLLLVLSTAASAVPAASTTTVTTPAASTTAGAPASATTTTVTTSAAPTTTGAPASATTTTVTMPAAPITTGTPVNATTTVTPATTTSPATSTTAATVSAASAVVPTPATTTTTTTTSAPSTLAPAPGAISTTPIASQSSTSVLLPINAAHEPKITLAVTVPAHFQALDNPQKIPGFAMMEFIPANETGDNWTQIVTTNSFINKALPAPKFIEYLQQRFQQAATQVTVMNSSLDNYPNYQRSCTTMDYHVNQRHEMVAMCYYSGPYDTAGVQYAILYPADNPSAADVAKKLDAFLKTQTQVLNQEKPLGS